MFLRSPRGMSSPWATSASTTLSTGSDSPVSADSSTLRLALSKMRQSAGTASPASSTTMSPTTRSSLFTSRILPSRTTFEVLAAICCRASKASSALDSCTTPSTALTTTTKRMMITSAMSDSPWAAPATALMTAAARSRMIIGSASWASRRFQSGSFSASSSLLGPLTSRRLAAWAGVRPVSELLSSSESTSSLVETYAFKLPSWWYSLIARSAPDHNSPGGARARQGCHGASTYKTQVILPSWPERPSPLIRPTKTP